MIEYIVISYIIMFVWCVKWWFCEDETLKTCFKLWVVSPIYLPFCLLVTFVEW